MGLLSDGGVHSYQEHLEGLLRMAKRRGLARVFVHAFLDGRDTPPASGAGYLDQLLRFLAELGLGEVAVVCGRYYAMDRDKRWERVKLAYDAIVTACCDAWTRLRAIPGQIRSITTRDWAKAVNL